MVANWRWFSYIAPMPRVVTVVQGQCFTSLAQTYGFYDWRTIYDDPANEALREERPDPNHLLPGDRVTIPDKLQRVEPRATGARHRFVVNRQSPRLRIRLDELEPVRYLLTIGDVKLEGAGSIVDHALPVGAESAVLDIWLDPDAEEPALSWTLSLGHVDPYDETAPGSRGEGFAPPFEEKTC